ncbi:MAG TPA: AAA family ATPase [Stellaceae bacterium]|jgi:hypothetical protein
MTDYAFAGPAYALEELEDAVPDLPGDESPLAGTSTIPGTPPALLRQLQGSTAMAAAMQALIDASRWFEWLPTELKNSCMRAIARHPAIAEIANGVGRDGPGGRAWLDLLFGFADAERLGATEARQIALCEWSQTSGRFVSKEDFQKDWGSFKPGLKGLGTLLDTAEAAGLDLEPWRAVARSIEAVTTGTVDDIDAQDAGFWEHLDLDNLEERPWILYGQLMYGEISDLIATKGTSKTTTAMFLAVHLAAARLTFGPFAIERVRPEGFRVGYITGEEKRRDLNRGIAAAMATAGMTSAERELIQRNLIIRCPDADKKRFQLCAPRPGRREDMVPEEFDTALAQLIRVARGLDVLILDTKAALISIASEVNNAQQTEAMRRLALVTSKTGCAILLLSHTAKLSREDLAAQRGQGMASRGGGGAVAAVKGGSMTLTKPNASEAERFERLGLDPDYIIRLEHDATNHSKRMDPVHLQVTSVELTTGSGVVDVHQEKAVRFINIPTTGTVILYRDAALRAIDEGVVDKGGVRVPLSATAAGRENERKPVGPIKQALIRANPRLADVEKRAEAMAREILKELLSAGLVLAEDAPIPRYNKDGSLHGKPKSPCLFRAENAPSRKAEAESIGTEGGTTVVAPDPAAQGASSTPDSK